MRIVIFRRNSLLNIFIFVVILALFFMSFINFFNDNTNLITDIAITVGIFLFLLTWLWMIIRNYLQVFDFKKEGIYTHKGFKKYLHFKYKDIKKIKIITFDNPPEFCRGAKIRGVDSVLPAPKKTPKKWIVITDGREDDNSYNYNSYLVPIREHMVIKFKYSEKNANLVSKYTNIDIEYETISFEEMDKNTPKIKIL